MEVGSDHRRGARAWESWRSSCGCVRPFHPKKPETWSDPVRPASYAYDTNGDLGSVTDRLNNVTQFSYDDDHYLLDDIDPSVP